MKTSERKLEPTPGWCERTYGILRGARDNINRVGVSELIAEYEAAKPAPEPLPHEWEVVTRCWDLWVHRCKHCRCEVHIPASAKPFSGPCLARNKKPEQVVRESRKSEQPAAKLCPRCNLEAFVSGICEICDHGCEGEPVANPWPDPTPEMLKRSDFESIWQCIKSWDINVPGVYRGYMGATGNHVRAILDALDALKDKPAAKDAELPEELLAACKDLSRKTGPYSRNESIQNLCVVLLAEVDRRIEKSKPTTEGLYQLIADVADERIGKAHVERKSIYESSSPLILKPGDK